jgi:hypothetical protein
MFTNATRRRDANGAAASKIKTARVNESHSVVQSKSEHLPGAVTIDNNATSRKNVSFRTKNWLHVPEQPHCHQTTVPGSAGSSKYRRCVCASEQVIEDGAVSEDGENR